MSDFSKIETPILKTAFVVDDEPEMCNMMAEIISETGIKVITFTNPKEALQGIENSKPNVVFTDIKMPDITGFDVLKKIHQLDSNIPVVYMSAFISKELLMKSINLGVYSVIEKPPDKNAIISIAINASNYCQALDLLNRSMDLINSYFDQLEGLTEEQTGIIARKTIKNEIEAFFALKRDLQNTLNLRVGTKSP